jgi:hypothetical protein
MIQRATGLVVVGLLAMPILAGAQTTPVKHPDFTGSWKATNIDSQAPKGGGGGGGARGFGGGGRGFGGGGFGGGRRRGGGGYGGGNPQGGNTSGNTSDASGDNDAANRPLQPEVGQIVHMRQTDTQLIVTEQGSTGPVMSNFTLDGKETTNTTGITVSKSKSKWDGVALVTDSTRTIDTGRGKISTKSREILSLSEDGQQLTVRNEVDTPRGKQTTTVTYVKVDE